MSDNVPSPEYDMADQLAEEHESKNHKKQEGKQKWKGKGKQKEDPKSDQEPGPAGGASAPDEKDVKGKAKQREMVTPTYMMTGKENRAFRNALAQHKARLELERQDQAKREAEKQAAWKQDGDMARVEERHPDPRA